MQETGPIPSLSSVLQQHLTSLIPSVEAAATTISSLAWHLHSCYFNCSDKLLSVFPGKHKRLDRSVQQDAGETLIRNLGFPYTAKPSYIPSIASLDCKEGKLQLQRLMYCPPELGILYQQPSPANNARTQKLFLENISSPHNYMADQCQQASEVSHGQLLKLADCKVHRRA